MTKVPRLLTIQMKRLYFDQLLLAARKVHVVFLDQLLGAAHYTHFISNHDKMCTREDTFAQYLGTPYLDDVMSHNELSHISYCPFSVMFKVNLRHFQSVTLNSLRIKSDLCNGIYVTSFSNISYCINCE